MSKTEGFTQYEWKEFTDLLTKANRLNLLVMEAKVKKELYFREKRDEILLEYKCIYVDGDVR